MQYRSLDSRCASFVRPVSSPVYLDFSKPLRSDTVLNRISENRFDWCELGGSLQHRGYLIVEQLFSDTQVAKLLSAVKKTLDASDRYASKDQSEYWNDPWFQPVTFARHGDSRVPYPYVYNKNSIWAANSPMAFSLIEQELLSSGITQAIDKVLGEKTYLSVRKTVLRRSNPLGLDMASYGWHQDGAFLGESTRSVNCWIALTDCGEDAPGLDFVPIRANKLFQTGTGETFFNWGVGRDVVRKIVEDCSTQIVSPLFSAGDVMFFDQLLLHCSGVTPRMNQTRYAIEAWHFAGSTFPEKQIGISR